MSIEVTDELVEKIAVLSRLDLTREELDGFKDQDIPFDKDTDEVVLDICGDLDIPIISNFPCGHGAYQATLPISIPIELCANEKDPKIKLLEPAVEINR